MKLRLALAASLVLFSLPLFSNSVSAQVPKLQQKMMTCHVSLIVEHALPTSTTLWLVYGPPARTFGIVRLLRMSGTVYAASLQLPTGSRARFSYLAGHGEVRTPEGMAPGNPYITIREFTPRSVSPRPLPTVHWSGLIR